MVGTVLYGRPQSHTHTQNQSRKKSGKNRNKIHQVISGWRWAITLVEISSMWAGNLNYFFHCYNPSSWYNESGKKKKKWKLLSCVQLFATPVHGILQARILEWAAFPFSRGSSQPRDWIQVSHIAGGSFTNWAIRDAQKERCFNPVLNQGPFACEVNVITSTLYAQ